ncbi:DUF4113 domain-containing protein [Rhizobium sp. CFBP 8752]|uniref:DUF4113 domain-containing protein n=1 Tax=Rhizobium sp. CFBP 8752 TaxID=2775301 RepID=UPI0017844314|nr:DUF4113 domain-containing protein [Rhizobium sp. CFBP 8752]MBD8663027.1 DUF4113 domain-containing protein [Rhizobium sp. CFBP 8752]
MARSIRSRAGRSKTSSHVRRLSAAREAVNDRWGKEALILASEGFKHPFATKADMRSPRYTTRMRTCPLFERDPVQGSSPVSSVTVG